MTGVVALTCLAVRRSRLFIVVWTVALVAMVYASATATDGLYSTTAERIAAAKTINASPAVVALYGPILDLTSRGELAMTKMTVTYAVLVMVFAVTLVRRHTRVEEESGRAELVGSLAVDRSAPVLSAVAVGTVASLLVGVLAGLADIAGGLPVAGSLWFGASWTAIGLVATGIAAVAAQMSASSRTSGAIAAATIAALFVLRALGDTTSASWLSWLSPLGWSTRLRAWSDPRLWVLGLDLAVAVLLVGAALVLRHRRDLGSGLLQPRPGPSHGSPRLRSVFALTVRMQMPSLVVWTVACAVMGVLLAAIIPNVGSLVDSPGTREIFDRLGGAGGLHQTLMAAFVSIEAVVISGYAASVIAHGGSDEHDGRTEEILATAQSKSATFAALALVALGGTVWLLAVTGVALALGATGADIGFGEAVTATLAYTPATAVVAGLALTALAMGSRFAVAGWGVIVGAAMVGPIAEMLGLPGWVSGLSPYSHVPKLPAEGVRWAPLLVLTAIAAVLIASAARRYRMRDVG